MKFKKKGTLLLDENRDIDEQLFELFGSEPMSHEEFEQIDGEVVVLKTKFKKEKKKDKKTNK